MFLMVLARRCGVTVHLTLALFLAFPGFAAAEQGFASYYGKRFQGKPMSNGHLFDMNVVTIAHRTLPLGTRVVVRNLNNGLSVTGVVTDRGPYVHGRICDLSQAAAVKLDMIEKGVVKVELIAKN